MDELFVGHSIESRADRERPIQGIPMSILTSAIVSHEFEAIESALASNPALAHERVNGWLPIEWAEKTGNLYTLVRTARLIGHEFTPHSARVNLKKYVDAVSSAEYEEISTERAATMVWGSLFEGKSYTIDRWKRPLIPSEQHAEDLRYLCRLSGISSPSELFGVL